MGAPKKPSKKPGEDQSFAEMIGEVRPVRDDTAPAHVDRPPPRRLRHLSATTDTPDELPAIQSPAMTAPATFRKGGVQNSVMRKLQRGQFPLSDELDLHGCTLKQAFGLLNRFLPQARRERMCCIRIIHGKGLRSRDQAPVLKPNVAAWLRDNEMVLAYAPALPRDGGDGALYVLLRARPG